MKEVNLVQALKRKCAIKIRKTRKNDYIPVKFFGLRKEFQRQPTKHV